jgi:hypothetical protein
MKDRNVIRINKMSNEDIEDMIMKSYEGIFINENINGIMINLLKKHDNIRDINKLYQNTNDNECDNKKDSIFRNHGKIILNNADNAIADTIARKLFIYNPNSFKFNATDDEEIENFKKQIDFMIDMKDALSIDYCSNNIFYVGKTEPTLKEDIDPIFNKILKVYLEPTGNNDYMHCNDFTFLIVLTNLLGFQKCNEQVKLLKDMKQFIETVSAAPIEDDDE